MTRRKSKDTLDRAVGFFKELSNKTITRSDLQKMAKEHGVRNGLDRFILQRGWAKKSYGKPTGSNYTISTFKFIDLSEINPIHVRMVLDDHNKYLLECKRKRNREAIRRGKQVEEETTTLKNVVKETEEQKFNWNADTTKMFAKIYSGNWKALPPRFIKENYDGLKMDDKVSRFIKDFTTPDNKEITITLTETYTRTVTRTIEVPGGLETDEYLHHEDNSPLTEFEGMPRITGTQFADVSDLELIEKDIQWSDNNKDEAGKIFKNKKQ